MKKLILMSLGLIILNACQNNPAEQTAPPGSNQELIAPPEEHVLTNGMRLNNGEKWLANPETHEGINTMMLLVSAMPEQPTSGEYKSLKDQLDKEFGTILERCTMKGEAHDQLHNYLMPLKQLIEKLSSNDVAKNKENLRELKDHLDEFKVYFK